MANVRHASLTGADLHETKGVSTANVNSIHQAGTGVGLWSTEINPTKLTLSDPVWNDVVVPAQALTGGGANAPGFQKLTDNGSASTGVFCYQFDAASEENLYFILQLPHGYKAGSNIRPHVHWCPTSTNTGNVIWGLEYTISNVGVVMGATTLINVTTAAPGVSLQQVVSSFAEIVGTVLKESSILMGRLFRKAADGSDTYTADAALLGLDFHIQIEKLGSTAEFPS